MIRKLESSDKGIIEELFGDKSLEYTLILDTIYDSDFRTEGVDVYGDIEDDKLISILLNNHGNLTYYSADKVSIDKYIELLEELDYYRMSSEDRFIRDFSDRVEYEEIEESQFGYISRRIETNPASDSYSIDCINDNPDLLTEEYFEYFLSTDEGILDRARSIVERGGIQKFYCISKSGKALSSVMVVLKQSRSTIVHGVLTVESERRKGLSEKLLTHVFNELIDEGKFIYLFYINPVAKELFLKLGMKEIGEWRIMWRPE